MQIAVLCGITISVFHLLGGLLGSSWLWRLVLAIVAMLPVWLLDAVTYGDTTGEASARQGKLDR